MITLSKAKDPTPEHIPTDGGIASSQWFLIMCAVTLEQKTRWQHEVMQYSGKIPVKKSQARWTLPSFKTSAVARYTLQNDFNMAMCCYV